MQTEKTMVKGAIQGVAISLLFAFAVLLVSTMNILIALYSTLCIVIIVVSIMGIMQILGWQLGVTESVALVVLIGFSVDYVVHLANHFVESHFKKRVDRLRHSLKEIGVSILSGAVTTILSGMVLYLCSTTLFKKFSIIIVGTIFLSIYIALFFFSSLCYLIGPNGTFGDLRHWLWNPFKKWVHSLY